MCIRDSIYIYIYTDWHLFICSKGKKPLDSKRSRAATGVSDARRTPRGPELSQQRPFHVPSLYISPSLALRLPPLPSVLRGVSTPRLLRKLVAGPQPSDDLHSPRHAVGLDLSNPVVTPLHNRCVPFKILRAKV